MKGFFRRQLGAIVGVVIVAGLVAVFGDPISALVGAPLAFVIIVAIDRWETRRR